jgi:hypothetical protein
MRHLINRMLTSDALVDLILLSGIILTVLAVIYGYGSY